MTAFRTAVVDAQGRFDFGRFTEPFFSANLADAHLGDYVLGLRQPTRWNTWLRALRLKEWHFLSLDHTDIFLAFAVAQLGYVSNLFAYAVDKRTGKIYEWGARLPLGRGLSFGSSSIEGRTVWRSRGCALDIVNEKTAWDVKLELKDLSARFRIQRDEAMALVFPLSPDRAAYTHKEAGNPVLGTLQMFGESFALNSDTCLGASDWTRSFCNYITAWTFACFGGRDGKGTRIGLNLSGLIYDDAHGTSQENTVWIDGKSHRVGATRFLLPETKQLAKERWRMEAAQTSPGVRLELEFEPIGARREHVSLGLLASKFTQAFGYYSGSITVDGQTYHVHRIFGVAEKHYSRW
ncbi:MAG TPA: DUF2804 domain-containing protein [Oligoflexus sp.]|uniref:DUF2804 domain-containing protein n=1 Tax=Oligoflexus sp. TaxID=1971216 RepID=UPI002D7E3A5D|nr:DUF2804 domain-containing protein [Oligoflexus sp.]HET9237426.1 DUF2804 domain-containing protein [Oligoflexus sp.]